MRKRRERVKAWQDARAAMDQIEAKSKEDSAGGEGGDVSSSTEEAQALDDGKAAGWSLEDDDEDQAVAIELDESETGMHCTFLITPLEYLSFIHLLL